MEELANESLWDELGLARAEKHDPHSAMKSKEKQQFECI